MTASPSNPVDVAYAILQRKGPLHFDELVKYMWPQGCSPHSPVLLARAIGDDKRFLRITKERMVFIKDPTLEGN